MIAQRTPEPIDLAELDRLHEMSWLGLPNLVVPHMPPEFPRVAYAAYPALRRVVEALQLLMERDKPEKYYPYGLTDDQADDTPVKSDALKSAIALAREALSAFKLPEAG